MAWYFDKVGAVVRDALRADEAVIGAIPAALPEPELPHGHVLRGTAAARRGARAATVLTPDVSPEPLPFRGRMVLVATDQRLLVYSRRRLRTLPRRLLGTIPHDDLGNVEGHYRPNGGLAELELTVILAGGEAIALRVPQGFVDDGKVFVRRLQAALRKVA